MTVFRKPNLTEIVRAEKEARYRTDIEKAQAELDSLNRKADSLENHNYEIAQRAHLAVYIDETRQAYLEVTGRPYEPRRET